MLPIIVIAESGGGGGRVIINHDASTVTEFSSLSCWQTFVIGADYEESRNFSLHITIPLFRDPGYENYEYGGNATKLKFSLKFIFRQSA